MTPSVHVHVAVYAIFHISRYISVIILYSVTILQRTRDYFLRRMSVSLLYFSQRGYSKTAVTPRYSRNDNHPHSTSRAARQSRLEDEFIARGCSFLANRRLKPLTANDLLLAQ